MMMTVAIGINIVARERTALASAAATMLIATNTSALDKIKCFRNKAHRHRSCHRAPSEPQLLLSRTRGLHLACT